MADKDFVVKNSLVVNTSVTANSTTVVANGVTINSTGGFYDGYVNATAFTGGNTAGDTGIIANTSQVFVGNTTVNVYLNTVGLNVNNATIANTIGVYTGTVNAAVHSIGTTMVANNSGIFFPTGNIVSSSVNTTFGYVNGFIRVANTTGNVNILPGLYSINATGVVNASSYTIGANLVANTIGIYHTGTVNAASHTTGGGYGTATGGATVNSTVIALGNSSVNGFITANSTTSYYTGTAYVAASIPLITSNVEVRTANITINATAGIIANGSIGAAGQALFSNASSVYWGAITSGAIAAPGSDTYVLYNDNGAIAATVGLKFNKVSNTITIGSASVNATVNSTVYTGTANNASYLGGTIASSYAKSADATYIGTTSIALNRSSASQTLNGVSIDGSANSTTYIVANTGLVSNATGVYVNAAYINTISSNSTNFVGTVSAANVVSNTQLSGNLSLYVQTTGLNSNVSALGYMNTSSNYTITGVHTYNANVALTTPLIANSSAGTRGHVLYSNGTTGSAYWAAVSAVAGSDTQVQFNDGGSVSNGSANFTFTKSNSTLTVNGPITGGAISGTSGTFTSGVAAIETAGNYTFRAYANASSQLVQIQFTNNAQNAQIGVVAANNTCMYMDGGNGVQIQSLGIGTNPSSTVGEIRATNNITAYYSDDRLKTRKGNIENALSKVQSLNGFHYEANETAQALGYKAIPEVGVSAQEVQAIMPEVVVPAPIDEQYLTVRYEKLIPLLIEAIKELKAELDALKNRE